MKLRTRLIGIAAVVFALSLGGTAWYYYGGPTTFPELEPYRDQCNYGTLLKEVAAQQPAPAEWSFAVFGDTRNNVPVAREIYSQAAKEHPVFMVNTGDLVRGGTVEEYIENYLPLLDLVAPVPVFCVPGNHERGPRRDFATFKYLFGDTRFSFDYGGCRFVGFNASEWLRISKDELAFLEAELSKPGAAHKFVFFHIPPAYFEAEIVNDARRGFTWNADALRKTLSKHAVDEVFMGHIHGYASRVIDGVRYTLTAGAGAPLSERLATEGQAYNYVVRHIAPEGIRREVVLHINGEWVRSEEE